MVMEIKSYERIIENLHDGLYFVNRNRVITYWNKAAEKISGFSALEVIGKSCRDNILTHVDAEGRSLCKGLCPLAAAMKDGTPREAEVYMHHKNGHRVPVSVRVNTLTNDHGEIIGGIELFSDISGRSASELRVKELEKIALLDNLTQLANRHYIQMELEKRFEEARRFQSSFGLLFMDIDHFKRFNDTYGHDVGDDVLKLVAATFTANARPFDLFGRWGGEEFVGIIRNVDKTALEGMADRMRHLVANSYLLHREEKLHVTISMGATLVAVEDDIDRLIKRADTLLYESKTAGRNCVTMG